VDADAGPLQQPGRGQPHQVADAAVQAEDLLVEQQPTPAEAAQGGVQAGARRELAASGRELQQAWCEQLVTEMLDGADEQGLDLVDRGRGGLDGAVAGDRQCSQGFDGSLAVFGHGGGLPGEHGPSGGLSVDRVALAFAAAVGPVRSIDLQHLHPSGLQGAGELVAVAAGTLDASGEGSAMLPAPGQQRRGACLGRGELQVALVSAEAVDGDGDVGVFVGVDPQDGGAGHDQVNLSVSSGPDRGGRSPDRTLTVPGKAPIGSRRTSAARGVGAGPTGRLINALAGQALLVCRSYSGHISDPTPTPTRMD